MKCVRRLLASMPFVLALETCVGQWKPRTYFGGPKYLSSQFSVSGITLFLGTP